MNDTLDKVTVLSDSSKNIEAELRQMHKLYHNEFRTMLDSMEKEQKHYRNVNEGKVFDGILSELAKLYAENIEILHEITDGDAKTRLGYLFEDLLQILGSHGVSIHQSKVNEPRNSLFTQLREKIETDKKELHGMVSKSHGIALHKENQAFTKERVDVYIYNEKKETEPTAGEEVTSKQNAQEAVQKNNGGQ